MTRFHTKWDSEKAVRSYLVSCRLTIFTAIAKIGIACVNSEMRDKIRRKVRCMVDDTVALKELDFCPTSETPARLYDSAAV